MHRNFLFSLLALSLTCLAAPARETALLGAAQESAGKKPAPDRRGDIIDELRADYGDVVDQFARKNTDAAMRAKQQRIIDNLKRLLDEEDPSPNSAPPPDQAPAPQPRNAPIESKQPRPGNAAQRESLPRSIEKLPGAKKNQDNAWPPLPPRQREAMDAQSQNRFPPRYEELLRAYYRNVGQSDRRQPEE